MKIFNSLSRKIEEFEQINKGGEVGVYTCGPTVYFYPHVGNWRTFILGDLVVRSLKYFGYDLHYVMNITDVGHLTGDNLGDADTGEDRLEKGSKREGKTAWDIAKFYSDDFVEGYKKLNMIMPTLDDGKEGYCVATDHIAEQIEMVKKIEESGFAYRISDGIYFDVEAYEKAGNEYGRMSNIHKDNVEARVAKNTEKRDQRDFALWKFSPENEKRQMEWESPWGVGFPGWHIECSAMSTKYLGNQFDIHIGGEDHKSTHHPNEIAQTEAAYGKKPFVKYWLHGAFLQVDGGRMGKSLGNAYSLHDIEERGYTPEHLRYFYLTGHYRKPLNFTWESMESAKQTYGRLVEKVLNWSKGVDVDSADDSVLNKDKMLEFEKRFQEYLGDDLNMPKVLALVWEVVKTKDLNEESKFYLILNWDDVLGLNLELKIQNHQSNKDYQALKSGIEIESNSDLNDEIISLIDQREQARVDKNWSKADDFRDMILKLGYIIKDTKGKIQVNKS